MQHKNTKQAKRLSIDCCLPGLVVGHFVVGRWSKKSQANMVAIIAVVAPAAGRAHLQNIANIAYLVQFKKYFLSILKTFFFKYLELILLI